MAKFDHLKSREIAGKTAWLHVPQVSPLASLQLRPAIGEANPGYRNEMLKRATSRMRATASKRSVSTAEADQSRADDRALYPTHVVVDWTGIEDSEGNPVQFSVAEAQEFFEVLPQWIFDRIRLFCMMPENFLLEGQEPPDAKGLAGNSESDSSGS